MPEGPEIKRAADSLALALKGQRVERIIFSHQHLQSFEQKLKGEKIANVCSRSKAILTQFNNGLTIYSHNQLYGCWAILPEGEFPPTSRSLRLSIHTKDKMALLYSASDIDVLNTQQLASHSYIKKLGPELLDTKTDIDTLLTRFQEAQYQRRNLFTLLQDQQFISGLGNYLCCEILHSCGIHPGKRLIDLDSQQKNYLAGQCLKLTFQSYNTGGITNLITRAKSLRKAGLTFEDFRFLVYRRAGLPCYRCSTVIVKQQYGGKTGYICPICQKL